MIMEGRDAATGPTGDEAQRIYQRQVDHRLYSDDGDGDGDGDTRPSARVAWWELLWRYADWLDCGAMAAGSLAAAIHGAAYPAYFLIFSHLINELGSHSSLASSSLVHRVSRYAEYFFYLGLVLMVSGWLEISLWMYTGDRQCAKMRALYVKALITQDVSFYDKYASTTKAMLGLSIDIALIQEAIGAKVGNFISYACRFIAGFVIAFASEWRLTLITLCMMPILATLASESKQAYVRAGKIAEESVSQIRTVQAFGSQERAIKSFSDALLLTRKLGHRSGLVKGLGIGSIYGMGLAVFSLLLWYSGRLVRSRITNGGQAFVTIINVLASTLALGQAALNVAAFSRARVSGHTILEMINKKPHIRQEKGQGTKLANIEGRIDIRDVSFSYPSRPHVKIFQNFSLSIPAGKVVSIVGGSGSGKSTVISLIERFYDPNSGEVLLDGHNIKTLDLKWLRNQMALVNQEPALFATTIKENILYGKEGCISMDEIIQAASISRAHEFINMLPLGYETEVGERGIQLSGGQKQRIAIARAILKDPSILLLDEATSALDTDTEKSVLEVLDRVMVGRTTLVVAHRLSTIQKADLIAVMQEGKVVECGLHEELKDKGEVYSSLIQIQEDSLRQAQEAARYQSRLSHGSLSQRTGSFASNADSTTKSVSGMNVDGSEVGQTLPAMHKNPWERLLRGCLREWQCGLPAAFGALVAGAQTPLFALAITQGVVYLYSPDQEHVKKAISKISILCATIGFTAVIAYVCENYFAGVVGESLTMQIRKSMFSGILRNEIGWFDQHSTSLLTTQLSMDALIIRTATADRLITLLHNIGLVATAFAIAFSIQWKVTLVVIAAYPIMIGANIGETMFMKGFLGDSNKAYGRANTIASEAICNIRTVAAFSTENKVMHHFTKALEQPHKKAFVRGQVAGLGYGVSQLGVFSSYGLALWYSSSLIQKREAGFGDVMKCYMVLIITAFGIAEALALAPDMAKSSEKISSVFEIVDRKTQIDADDPEGENVTELKGEIEFKQVDFSYPARMDIIVLQKFNLKVRAGQSLALVGASGSGKSSVISLIARFYDPQNGQLLVDGKDIKRMNLRSLRQHMGLVQQEPALFSTNIYENIRYGKEGASEAEVIEAAKAANAHSFICSLPEGFRTEVGERGVQLSGGQKQRVAIARAILRNPAILLLDEATSALDAESEKAIQQALERLMQHRTTVMAAHRLSTIQNANSIAVLGHGSAVVEQGSHHELLSKRGTYFNLLHLSACTDQPQGTMP